MIEVVTDVVIPILATSGAASVAAALLPRPASGSKWGIIFKVIDLLAANWMNARNAR